MGAPLPAAVSPVLNDAHAQELASGGDLFRKGGKSYAQGEEHKAVKQVMIPMLKALQYLHEKVTMNEGSINVTN